MSLPIVHYNEAILRKRGEKIHAFDAPLAQLAAAMIETMREARGIGLAAQQIGRALQLCVVDLRQVDEPDFDWELDGNKPPLDLFMPLIVINPKIIARRGVPEEEKEEGCLSFPEIRGAVSRLAEIEARFQDEHGLPHTLVCNGLLARCLQHEADHLNGVLFIDRMEKKVRAEIEEAVKALARETKGAKSPAA